MSNQKRKQILHRLIQLDGDLETIQKELKSFAWDANEYIIVVTMNDLKAVLTQYLEGKKTIDELERWADLIECREDIDFEDSQENKIKTIVHHLANPELNGKVSVDIVRAWLKE
jgi:hypothetical protein